MQRNCSSTQPSLPLCFSGPVGNEQCKGIAVPHNHPYPYAAVDGLAMNNAKELQFHTTILTPMLQWTGWQWTMQRNCSSTQPSLPLCFSGRVGNGQCKGIEFHTTIPAHLLQWAGWQWTMQRNCSSTQPSLPICFSGRVGNGQCKGIAVPHNHPYPYASVPVPP